VEFDRRALKSLRVLAKADEPITAAVAKGTGRWLNV